MAWCFETLPCNGKFSLSVPPAADAVPMCPSTVPVYKETKAATAAIFIIDLPGDYFFIDF